jgi:hypothetical protein
MVAAQLTTQRSPPMCLAERAFSIRFRSASKQRIPTRPPHFKNIGIRAVAIPAEGGSNSAATIAVESRTACPSGAPTNANCATYTLIEPTSNPRLGVLTSGTISYLAPLAGPVPYTIRADAVAPLSGGISSCRLPSQRMNLNTNGTTLNAIPGAVVNVREIDFSGCS